MFGLCVCVGLWTCVIACLSLCVHARTCWLAAHDLLQVCMYICVYVCILYVCVYVCMYVCMHMYSGY